MSFCLMAPSRHLKQCQFICTGILWHLPKSNFTLSDQATILYAAFKHHIFKIATTSPNWWWRWNSILLQKRFMSTDWGRVTHIWVNKLTIIALDNGLSPGRRQAIILTNAGILLIGPWETKFSEFFIGIQIFSFKKMHLKMSSANWRPFCLGLNVLNVVIEEHMGVVFVGFRRWLYPNNIFILKWMYSNNIFSNQNDVVLVFTQSKLQCPLSWVITTVRMKINCCNESLTIKNVHNRGNYTLFVNKILIYLVSKFDIMMNITLSNTSPPCANICYAWRT